MLFAWAVLLVSMFVIYRLLPRMPKEVSSDFELVGFYRVSPSTQERFDLSGVIRLNPKLRELLGVQSDFILTNDQTGAIYSGDIQGSDVIARPLLDLTQWFKNQVIHLQDIDTSGDSVFAMDEEDGYFFEIQSIGKKKPKTRSNAYVRSSQERAGPVRSRLGGIAVVDDSIFIVRELGGINSIPRTQNSKETPMARLFNNENAGSQTSIRIRGNESFTLDSQKRCIWVKKLSDSDPAIKLSFQKIVESPDFQYHIYDENRRPKPEWGTASSLDIDGSIFYIGLDNNGESLITNPNETRSTIMVLKRK